MSDVAKSLQLLLPQVRKFFLMYREGPTRISQTLSAKFPAGLRRSENLKNSKEITQTVSAISEHRWSLSWFHYLLLMGIKNPDERSLKGFLGGLGYA
ncbi:MAG: hypothetical protein R3F37_12720 [Candidatus Competibacteraceae bacterium]